MHDLDLSTCSPRDVIARSMACHPTLLSEALMSAASIHRHAAGNLGDSRACAAARNLASDCHYAADNVRRGDVDAIMAGGTGQWTSALIQASKLQLIAPWQRQEIVERAELAVAIAEFDAAVASEPAKLGPAELLQALADLYNAMPPPRTRKLSDAWDNAHKVITQYLAQTV